jgi:thermostable 8-oxoguanine DNA glycosylase
MRHSKRIAAQPPSNAKPADRARDTKMKKLGLSIANADSKAEKKMQLLKKLGGNVLKHADEVLSQLLTGPEKVA